MYNSTRSNMMTKNPKVFISYSWSSAEYEEKILGYGTRLRECGVDAILDKWDLKEGNDSVAFMEKMVTDPTIEKVIIFCDKVYAGKADGRAGGVGTETQIISKEVYDKQEQNKFILVVTERDENGKACLPVYYKSRIYIDFSQVYSFEENFDKLLRCIYDKPLHVKPEIGKKPSFLDDPDAISLETSSSFNRAISLIKENKPNASGAIDEYFSIFKNNLEKFRLTDIEEEFDDALIENIDKFIPHRNEILKLYQAICLYAPTEENVLKIHRFLESLIPYMNRTENMRSSRETDFDNFKFIIHELFLYTIAIFLKNECFEEIKLLLNKLYYVPKNENSDNQVTKNYTVFNVYLRSLEVRKNRLKLNRISLHADLLKERCQFCEIEFQHLMQADFVLFIRTHIDKTPFPRWYPHTSVYFSNGFGNSKPFEIFARSISKSYFEKVKCVLNISELNELGNLMEIFNQQPDIIPRHGYYDRFNPSLLINFDKLATLS